MIQHLVVFAASFLLLPLVGMEKKEDKKKYITLPPIQLTNKSLNKAEAVCKSNTAQVALPSSSCSAKSVTFSTDQASREMKQKNDLPPIAAQSEKKEMANQFTKSITIQLPLVKGLQDNKTDALNTLDMCYKEIELIEAEIEKKRGNEILCTEIFSKKCIERANKLVSHCKVLARLQKPETNKFLSNCTQLSAMILNCECYI